MMRLYFNTAGHLALRCDVSSEQEVQNAFEEMKKIMGPINYLVNAAGINRLVLYNSELQHLTVRCKGPFYLVGVPLTGTLENAAKCAPIFCS